MRDAEERLGMIRLRQFLTLARLTAVEILRQPVSLLIMVTALVLMGLSPLVLLHNFGESGKIVRDGALALHMLLGFMLAGYASASVMAREIRTGTASAVLSKPVDRSLFFLSKYAGVMFAVLFFSFCAVAGTLLAEKACEKFYQSSRIVGYAADNTTGILLLIYPFAACFAGALVNLIRKKPFVSSAFTAMGVLMVLLLAGSCFIDETGHLQRFYPVHDFRLINAGILIFMGLAVVAAIAMFCSVRLNTVQVMSVLGLVFVVGCVSYYFFGSRADTSFSAGLIYGLLPDWQHFWMSDALSGGGSISWKYILDAGIYTTFYSAALLAAGSVLFLNSELR